MPVFLKSTCSPITVGCVLEDGFGGFASDGYYSDGVNWYLVTGGSGLITASDVCPEIPPSTTTSTTSTTTTIEPTTTSTTTATPITATIEISADTFESAPSAGYLQFLAQVVSGTTSDLLTFTGIYKRYTNPTCTTEIAGTCSFVDEPLGIGASVHTSGPLCPHVSLGGQTSKLLSLDVNGTSITSNDQIITVGSNNYRILGFGDCYPL